jgi:hypothetical protein
MSTSIEISAGTKIEYSTNGGSTWTELAEVINVMGPKKKRKAIDVTVLRDSAKRKKAGKPDYGQATMEVGFTKANFAIISGWFDAGTVFLARITDASTSTEAFTTFVTDLERKFQDDEKVVADLTLEADGTSVFTAAP